MFTYILFIIVGIILFILLNDKIGFSVGNQLSVELDNITSNYIVQLLPLLDPIIELQLRYSGGPCSLYIYVQFLKVIGIDINNDSLLEVLERNPVSTNMVVRNMFIYFAVNIPSFKEYLMVQKLSPMIRIFSEYYGTYTRDALFNNTQITSGMINDGQLYICGIYYNYNNEGHKGHYFLIYRNDNNLYVFDGCYRNFEDNTIQMDQRVETSRGTHTIIDLATISPDSSIATKITKFWAEKHYIVRFPDKYIGELATANKNSIIGYNFELYVYQSPESDRGMYIGYFKIKTGWMQWTRKIFRIIDGYLEVWQSFEGDPDKRLHIYNRGTNTMCQFWKGRSGQEDEVDDTRRNGNYVTVRDLNGTVYEIYSTNDGRNYSLGGVDKTTSFDNINHMLDALEYYTEYMNLQIDTRCSVEN